MKILQRSLRGSAFAGLAVLLISCGSAGSTTDPEPDSAGTPEPEEPAQSAEPSDGDDSSEEDIAAFYEGETIEWIVPTAPGGGQDTFARLVAPYLTKHIPGGPAIQVNNVPGAGNVVGMNEYANSRDPDGLSILVGGASGNFAYLLGDPGVQFELDDFEALLAVPQGAVAYASTDAISSTEDLLDPAIPLVYAGQSVTGGDITRVLAFELLDLDVQMIFGFDGRGAARIAFEQGEATIDGQTAAAYLANVQPLVDAGEALPVFTQGLLDGDTVVRDPAFPDIPHVGEVYQELYGEEPSGQVWDAYAALVGAGNDMLRTIWVHGDAPSEARAALLEGVNAMLADPDFQSDAQESIGAYELAVGSEAGAKFDAVSSLFRESRPWVIEYLQEEFDVELD